MDRGTGRAHHRRPATLNHWILGGPPPDCARRGQIRTTPSILHLDLDAFFTSVEQRDKPSLAGRPVIVGGVGGRGVVATASYEARRYGARSAMPTAEARRRCPAGTAFLSGRFEAYRKSSAVVMGLLHELSPLVEQVSIDEAYVDLAAGAPGALDVPAVTALGRSLLARITDVTGGLTASAGIASSKMLAKIGSELDKPRGLTVVAPGDELTVLHALAVTRISGVGPATEQRLRVLGVRTVGDLARVEHADLVSVFGKAHGDNLFRLARADDDRAVVPEREAKSVSAEETFDTDVTDRAVLGAELDALADRVGARLARTGTFGRTVTLKVRRHDFSTLTRSETLGHGTNDPATIAAVARRLLSGIDPSEGLRLLGVGTSGLIAHTQDELLPTDTAGTPASGGPGIPAAERSKTRLEQAPEGVSWTGGRLAGTPPAATTGVGPAARVGPDAPVWRPGQDVVHAELGAGWVWGSGRGRVTVRFEGPGTPPGPVRTFPVDDPALRPGEAPDW